MMLLYIVHYKCNDHAGGNFKTRLELPFGMLH